MISISLIGLVFSHILPMGSIHFLQVQLMEKIGTMLVQNILQSKNINKEIHYLLSNGCKEEKE